MTLYMQARSPLSRYAHRRARRDGRDDNCLQVTPFTPIVEISPKDAGDAKEGPECTTPLSTALPGYATDT